MKTIMSAPSTASSPIHGHSPLSRKQVTPPPYFGKQYDLPLQAVSSGPISSRRDVDLPVAMKNLPKKPMRPLTAYHIFFQIEREYIIQTSEGEIADKVMHAKKKYLPDVPSRYRNIKLMPDWYAGPGKREKRKHRKQHGKIGFLELSRVVSTRWAELDQVDPETKEFVTKLAKAELDEYYEEMKAYKKLTNGLIPAAESSKPKKKPRKSSIKHQGSCMNGMGTNAIMDNMAPGPDMVTSMYQQAPLDYMPPPSSFQIQQNIDCFLMCMEKRAQQHRDQESIYNRKRHRRQGQQFFHCQDGASCSGGQFVGITRKQRTVSDGSSNVFSSNGFQCKSPPSAEVDICDDEILQLWKAHN